MANQQPLYKSYTPVAMSAPLFIRVANKVSDGKDIADSLAKGTRDPETTRLAEEMAANPPDMSEFVSDFGHLLQDIMVNGVVPPAVDYLNAYMQPSLLMHPFSEAEGSTGMDGYWLSIKDKEAPWLEAVVCYNLSAFLKLFGYRKIKLCSVCHKFFTNNRNDYKFCSEACSRRGGA
jgi:hypothetical protein